MVISPRLSNGPLLSLAAIRLIVASLAITTKTFELYNHYGRNLGCE